MKLQDTSSLWVSLLCLSLALVSEAEAAATKVRVEKWENLGTWTGTYQGGGTGDTYTGIKFTRGTMDANGNVIVINEYEDLRAILENGSSPQTKAFLQAAPGKWFVASDWSTITYPSPPVLGFNLPRGLRVSSSYPGEYANQRFDVVEPIAPGVMRFQMEPQDISGAMGDSFELEVFVLSPAVPLTVRWFKLLANGTSEELGIPKPLIGTTDSLYGVIDPSDIGASFYVEVSDGKKVIRSRSAKVLTRSRGNQDILGTSGGCAISGRVWEDLNNNDTDEVEPGVRGVTVSLIDINKNRQIVASTTTDSYGDYEFVVVPPGSYRVNWKFSENFHVARPHIGGDQAFDCDAESASSLINAPTSGPISQDSGLITALVGQHVQDIDLGLFAKPKLALIESAQQVIEGDTDIVIEVGFVLSKPLRYTPLTLYFKTFSFPKDGATRLVDYRQENVTSTTIPVGATSGVVRFTIVGDDLDEAPIEHFFVEPDQFLNKDHIFRDEAPATRQVYIIDDDVKAPDPKDLFREYTTSAGNRIVTGGYADFKTKAPLFWEPAPEIAINGLPAFKVGPANGLIAHSVLTSTNAVGPRTITFDWKMSGGSEDLMTVFSQDPAIQYNETNVPPIQGELSGTTGWQSVTVNLPAKHILNLNIFKGGIGSGSIQGWIRNLNLGGGDSSNTAETPEALALDGLEELQAPAPAEERALGVPSQNFSGVYSTTMQGGSGDGYQSGAVSNISVTTKGAFSGTVLAGGIARPVSGSFNGMGKFSGHVTASDGSATSVFLQMQKEVTSGAVEISGTVMDPSRNVGRIISQKPIQWITGIHPCPYAGRYTLILPQRAGGASDLPSGEGFATVVISQTGLVTIAGVLGDGTTLTAASSVTPSGRIPFQKQLYANKGGLTGALQIRNVPGVSDLDGKLRWVKPANAKATIHPQGFDFEVTSLGSVYTPTASPPFTILTGIGPWLGGMELAGGDFIKAPISIDTQITVKGSTMTLKEKAPQVGQTPFFLVRGTAALSTGIVTFTYEDKLQKLKATCQGVIFQKQNTLVGRLVGIKASGTFRLSL